MAQTTAAEPRISAERAAPLSPAGLHAWKGLLTAHARLVRRFDAQLQASHGVSLGDFDVFAQLDLAPGGSRRMCDLAAAVVLSPSGLTRRVARLEDAGLVVRRRSTDDARSVEASLSPKGKELYERLRKAHLEDVRHGFEDRLGSDDLETLGDLLDQLIDGDVAEESC